MRRACRNLSLVAPLAVVVVGLASAAMAAEPLVPAADPVVLAGLPLLPVAAPVTLPTATPDRHSAVSAAALADLSGGKEPVAILALTQGIASGNSIVAGGAVTSGALSVESGALNFNGIGNFVFNTGQNNVLQGVLNVYIDILPSLPTP